MKGIFVLLIGLFAFGIGTAHAQDLSATSMTLEQCVQYALEHSVGVQNAILDQQVAAAKVKETVGIGLPQISAAGSIVHNPKLPRFFTTYIDSATSGGATSFIPKDAVKQQNIQNFDIVAASNFFQLKSSGSASVTVNQMIFNGSYLVGLKASKTYKELSIKAANQSREQTIILVTKAYYNVIVNKERINLFTANIERVDSLLKNTAALNKNGFAEGIDVDRIQVNLNNLTVERDRFLNLNELGISMLKFQMNYPMEQDLNVSGDIKDLSVENPVASYQQEWDYKQRPDYQTLLVNEHLQELTIKNKYAAGVPTLNVFGTYGYTTQSPNIGGLFKTTSKFTDSELVGRDKWYNFSQIGLNLSVPIFSGGQRHYQVQQEKLNLLKVENNMKQLKNSIDLDVKQSTVNFDNALKSLTTQKANMDLASRVARITKIKYEQGVGSNIEVVDAENSLRQSQNNYYNALYDAMVARVDIDKAFGKILPNANVSSN